MNIEQTVSKNNRKKLARVGSIYFSILLTLSSLSCFSQNFTTRAPDGIGMTENFDFYVFWLNNENRMYLSLAMCFPNDTIHISPYNIHKPSDWFKAVTSHQFVHYYNYVSHGEIIKTDTSILNKKKCVNIDSAYMENALNLKKNVYKGGDGSSIYNAVTIKRAPSLQEGISAEYVFLERKLGQRGVDWKPLGQYLHPANGKYYDIIIVNLIKTNETKFFWFNITDFFGKSVIYFHE